MAGTDRTQPAASGGPAVVLVAPQLGENIGATARAMLNFGLSDLRLVNPRDGWPNPAATAMAAGAGSVLKQATVFNSTAEAITDLHRVYAITARPRQLIMPVASPRQAAAEMRGAHAAGETAGLIFGPEKAGLDNDDITLAGAVVTIPANPAFGSLNLGQAVLVMAYEWYLTGEYAESAPGEPDDRRPATAGELLDLFEHMEAELDRSGFLYPPERRTAMIKNLRAMWQRFTLSDHDVRTWRGIISALTNPRDRGGGAR